MSSSVLFCVWSRCFACMHVCAYYACNSLGGRKKASDPLGLELTDCCELPSGCCSLNPGPLGGATSVLYNCAVILVTMLSLFSTASVKLGSALNLLPVFSPLLDHKYPKIILTHFRVFMISTSDCTRLWKNIS